MSADLALRAVPTALAMIGKLSAREHEVFVLLARGTSTQQLADDLGISVKTADVQRSKVLAKRVVRNDRGLYRIALDSGALDS